jgi:outer membrane lipoprotein-sorting protein
MVNRLGLILIINTLIVGAYASGPGDRQLLEHLSDYYYAKTPLVLTFEIIQYFDEADSQSLIGTFYMSSEDKFRTDFIDQEIIFDGEWLWSWDQENDQVVVETLDPQSSLKFIFDMLHGNWESFIIDRMDSNQTDSLVVMELRTADENAFFQTIHLNINPITKELLSADYLDYKDGKTQIRFSSPEQLDKESGQTFFDTKRYENKEIIDLRP